MKGIAWMNVLKGLALSLLGFLLFLSLSVFGLAFTLNMTVLNPDWVVSEMKSLDTSSLAADYFELEVSRGEFSPELGTALVNTISRLEPVVKEQLGVATHTIYDYLLGESVDLDLAMTLRNTILSREFIASLVDELDITSLAREILREQLLAADVPREIRPYLESYLDDAITEMEPELEPWLKEQMTPAADSLLDYLFGESQSFNVLIPVTPIEESFRDGLKQAFLLSPPSQLAAIPEPELEQYFDLFYDEAVAPQIPAAIQLDESLLGTEVRAQLSEALVMAEEVLAEGREYVAQFQLWYNILIVFMILLVIGIILIIRQVKCATRELGIIFLTYGAFEYGGILALKYFGLPRLAEVPIPPALQTWLPQLYTDFFTPLEMFSLGFLIGGLALLIVSFVYKRGEDSD